MQCRLKHVPCTRYWDRRMTERASCQMYHSGHHACRSFTKQHSIQQHEIWSEKLWPRLPGVTLVAHWPTVVQLYTGSRSAHHSSNLMDVWATMIDMECDSEITLFRDMLPMKETTRWGDYCALLNVGHIQFMVCAVYMWWNLVTKPWGVI